MDAAGNPSPKAEWKVGLKDRRNFENEIFRRLSNSLPPDDKQDGGADFRHVIFPDDFSITELLGEKINRAYFANFSSAEFGKNADFSGIHFDLSANFSSAIFGNGTKFVRTSFGDGTDFGKVTFEGNVDFSNAIFRNATNFVETEFQGNADFAEANFGNDSNFLHAKFFSNVIFTSVKFGDTTHFIRTDFSGSTKFIKTEFGEDSNFFDAEFVEVASFDGATFGNSSCFDKVIFNVGAIFSEAKFGKETNFRDTKFMGRADLSAPKPNVSSFDFHRANFTNANFFGLCSFENRTFASSASFDGTVFHDLVEFHGCTFHQGMSFHKSEFLKTKENKFDNRKENDKATEALERSYRTLKLGMENLRARNEEAMFFALEMECRRNRGDVPRIERIAAMLYKHLSDYGQSIRWPLSWLGGVTVIMGSIYFYLLWATFSPAPTDIWGGAPKVKSVVAFTVEQMFRPFYVWSKDSAGIRLNLFDDSALLIPLLASLQSLATLSLLALFLLALRRRFKMD